MSQAELRPPGRPRLGSEDKRERILVEAFDLFAQHGYAGTSLTKVARAADISKPGLLHHFGSKQELFSAVLARRDAADLAVTGDFAGDVWSFLDWWVDLMERNARTPDMVGLYAVMAASGADPDNPAHQWLHRHLLLGVGHIAEKFDQGKEAGVVAAEAPSHELARTVVALSDGIQVQWLCDRADAAAAGAGDAGASPHGETPLDMAAHMRLLVDMIKARWALGRRAE